MKRAVSTLTIWSIVWGVFMFIFFSGEGAVGFAQEKSRRIWGAALFALGYIAYFITLFKTRAKKKGESVLTDERDEAIVQRSGNIAFIFTLCVVFLLCITLWDAFQKSGMVPVGWMWFIAYTTSFLAMISNSLVIIILNKRMSGHGES